MRRIVVVENFVSPIIRIGAQAGANQTVPYGTKAIVHRSDSHQVSAYGFQAGSKAGRLTYCVGALNSHLFEYCQSWGVKPLSDSEPKKGDASPFAYRDAISIRLNQGDIYIGTSGWSYKGWAKTFYPSELPVSRHLNFYSTKFPTVEINSSFYRLPTEKAFEDWSRTVPSGFLYSVKGSRAVTHFKRLRPGAKSFDLLLNRSKLLGKHLGPMLWQLPGTLKKDLPRLEAFLRTLNRRIHHAIEFRDPSWVDKEVFETLREYRVANVALSSKAMPECFELTAGFAYVRFHGLEGGASHDYTDQELCPWATFLQDCANRGVRAFAYFNNDLNTRAPLNAQRLMDLVGAAARSPS